MYEVDRHLRKQMRKAIQQPIREVRNQIAQQEAQGKVETQEATQLAVLDDYALGIQTALNLEGQQAFQYASLAVDEALTEVATSLERLEKTGRPAAGAAPLNSPAWRRLWLGEKLGGKS